MILGCIEVSTCLDFWKLLTHCWLQISGRVCLIRCGCCLFSFSRWLNARLNLYCCLCSSRCRDWYSRFKFGLFTCQSPCLYTIPACWNNILIFDYTSLSIIEVISLFSLCVFDYRLVVLVHINVARFFWDHFVIWNY